MGCTGRGRKGSWLTQRDSVRRLARIMVYGFLCFAMALGAQAAPYAAMVIDARSGKVLHSRNADTRLHPASLTKMMTLYVAFDAVERGEISLDTVVTISSRAAAEPPSKLGLKAGQKIKLRYLIRAAAVKSANDAATAIGEAISGSEAKFARRMNRTAKALGMNRTTFRNAHGLTENGHMSTARDMTTLGRHLFYDFPDYYNLFSRTTTHAGTKKVYNTNRKLLANYRGADGIKTGYTRAAGYNLVASAERGQERIIATVFGGRSTATRNARVAELLDMGFKRAPSRVAVRKPQKPNLSSEAVALVAGSTSGGLKPAGKRIRVSGLIDRSPRPKLRPAPQPAEDVLIAMQDGIADALAEVAVAETRAEPVTRVEPAPTAVLSASLAGSLLRPDQVARPRARPSAGDDGFSLLEEPVVVTRLSASGGRHWGINVGRFTTRSEAEKMLLQVALVEMATLDDALRKVARSPQGWEANFVGMSAAQADLACQRLAAQNLTCRPVGPG